MDRIRKGQTGQEEELFQLWDEMRKKGIKDPAKAIKAAAEEFGIEARIAVIHMQRYTKSFGVVLLLLLLSSCVSTGYMQRKVAEARQEELQNCQLLTEQVRDKRLHATDMLKLLNYRREK